MSETTSSNTIAVSADLADAIGIERGKGELNFFDLLGLSPRQASPQDVKYATSDLLKRLRDILYDGELGKEARSLKKALSAIEERLATPRDIADYRRDIEAAPQRGQFALLRQFEEEARKAFADSPSPSRSLIRTMKGRARQIGLNESVAATLLDKLWAEFAPVPTDEREIKQQPSIVDDIRVDLTPEKRSARGEGGAAAGTSDAGPPSGASSLFGGFMPVDSASASGSAPGASPDAPPSPHSQAPASAAGAFFDVGELPTMEPGAKPAGGGMTFSDFLGSPLPPSGPPDPSARPGAAFGSPASIGAGLGADIPSPPLVGPSDSIGKAGEGGAPKKLVGSGSKSSDKQKLSDAKEATPPGGVIAASWARVADRKGLGGTGDVRLSRVDAVAWRGFYPAFGKSVEETKSRLRAATAAAGLPLAAGLASSAVASPALEEDAANAPTMDAIDVNEVAGGYESEFAPDAPRPVSFRRKRAEIQETEVADDDANPDATAVIGNLDFAAGPYAAAQDRGMEGRDNAWQVMTATPGEGAEPLTSAESVFIDRIYEIAGPKGLSRRAENDLIDEANSYGLTQGRALALIEERFPRKHKEGFTHQALAGLQQRRDAAAAGESPDDAGQGADGMPQPEFSVVEVELPYAQRVLRSLVTQGPGLIIQFLTTWQMILVLAMIGTFVGLSWLWSNVDDDPFGPKGPDPSEVIEDEGGGSASGGGASSGGAADGVGDMSEPAPTIDYLGSPLRTRAALRPDTLVSIETRFLDGGVLVPEFEVRASEVTMQEWQDFCDATNRPTPHGWIDGAPPPGALSFPITGVSFDEVLAYCRWKSDRDRLANARYLPPTSQQYMVLSRYAGPDSATGGISGAKLPNPAAIGGRDTFVVGGRELHHLFGNVAEWTLDSVSDRTAIVGYSWAVAPTDNPMKPRWMEPTARSGHVGFRYVRVSAP